MIVFIFTLYSAPDMQSTIYEVFTNSHSNLSIWIGLDWIVSSLHHSVHDTCG